MGLNVLWSTNPKANRKWLALLLDHKSRSQITRRLFFKKNVDSHLSIVVTYPCFILNNSYFCQSVHVGHCKRNFNLKNCNIENQRLKEQIKKYILKGVFAFLWMWKSGQFPLCYTRKEKRSRTIVSFLVCSIGSPEPPHKQLKFTIFLCPPRKSGMAEKKNLKESGERW